MLLSPTRSASIFGQMSTSQDGGVAAVRLRLERQSDGFGIGTPTPRLSWMTETSLQGWRQVAYEIDARTHDNAPLWSSGRVESDQSVFVPWGGAPLRSRQRCVVRARVWGSDGSESSWSEPVVVEAGLLASSDWTARFVGPRPDQDASSMQPCPMLRREFNVHGNGRPGAALRHRARRLRAPRSTATRVGDHVLAPGWTSYHHRLRYQTFDVTLAPAGKARTPSARSLGDGWYRGRIGFGEGRRNIYGDDLALLAQLEVTYADGSRQVVATDESWRVPPARSSPPASTTARPTTRG